MKKYDSIIVGSGQAGTPLAFELAKQGKTVAIIEKDKFGGTCVNNGCTPTKAYVASARRIHAAKTAGNLGVSIAGEIKANLKDIKARKDEIITASREGIEDALKETDGIDMYRGEAKFIAGKTLDVNREKLSARQIFLNVGGRPRLPKEYENAKPLTNASILELGEIPEHLVIVGGSYIGLELGQMFRRFGSAVTIVEKHDEILHREDPDVAKSMREILADEGVEFRLSATCLEAYKMANGKVHVNVDCKHKEPDVEGSHLLLAIGRVPNTDNLDVQKADLKTTDRGFIAVDEKLRTSVDGIYALGDCNGQGAFTHTSYNDFEIIKNHLFGDDSRSTKDRHTTYGLFTDPPLGRVGMTMDQAKKSANRIQVAEMEMSKVARAKEKGETAGFMRIIVDAQTEKILGAHVLGVGGDEVISGLTNLMYADASYKVLRDSVQIHPTVSELLPTMLESLQEPD